MENKWSFKEEAHAFKEDLYYFKSPGPSAGPNLACRVAAVEGSRVESQSGCNLEGRVAGGGSHVFVVCRVSGLGVGALRRDGAPSIVRKLAQAPHHARTTVGGVFVRTYPKVSLLSVSKNRDPPPSVPVSRGAERA